jgi:hypothetical protein
MEQYGMVLQPLVFLWRCLCGRHQVFGGGVTAHDESENQRSRDIQPQQLQTIAFNISNRQYDS